MTNLATCDSSGHKPGPVFLLLHQFNGLAIALLQGRPLMAVYFLTGTVINIMVGIRHQDTPPLQKSLLPFSASHNFPFLKPYPMLNNFNTAGLKNKKLGLVGEGSLKRQ